MIFDKKNIAKYYNVNRIILKDKIIRTLVISKDELFGALTNYILNYENLLYYCTLKSSCRTINDTRKYVKEIIANGLIKKQMNEVLNALGWNDSQINVNNTTFSGDIGEYLMNIFIDKLNISSTLISKISFKTNGKMPVYGNDSYFYDYKKNILYFGEAKFYKNTSEALKEAYNSIRLHKEGCNEISFICNHTVAIISSNGKKLKKLENKFENISIDELTISSISFVVSEDCYDEQDYINVINKEIENEKIDLNYINESIIIFLPIISKSEFLNYFKERCISYAR